MPRPRQSILTDRRTDGRTDERTDGQTDMARSTRLVILIKNIYTLWGRKRFLLPVTYFPSNQVYPFTLRVTGIISSVGSETHLSPAAAEFPLDHLRRLLDTTEWAPLMLGVLLPPGAAAVCSRLA